jgi:hypothetical protein
MGRKTERVVIDTPGRDLGRVFVITEMDSWNALILTSKIAHALSVSGINVPEIAKSPEGLAEAGIRLMTYIAPAVAVPIMEELRECVAVLPPRAKPGSPAQPLIPENQPHEIRTWFTLLTKLYYLHLGFSPAANTPISE